MITKPKDPQPVDRITCPKCGEVIPISERLSHEIAETTRKQIAEKVAEEVAAQRAAIEKSATERAQSTTSIQIENLQRQAAEKDQQIDALRKAELDFLQRKREVEGRAKSLELEFERRIDTEKETIRNEAAKNAEAALATKLKSLEEQAAEKNKRLAEAQATELKLRGEKRELEARAEALDLEVARKVDAERDQIRQQAIQQAEEKFRFSEMEKDKKLADALKHNEELTRKLRQGSQQMQGEVLELHIEELIRAHFPIDHMEPVPKGVTGADIIQRVNNTTGRGCGAILWETKRAKTWSEPWVSKLKENLQTAKADIAILVTEALPRDCSNFQNYSGVWVTNPQCAMALAATLRVHLIEVAMTKLAGVGKDEKVEAIYSYLLGSEFRQRVEAIVEAFIEMQSDLAEERRVTERRWSKREKQIQRVITNTAGMYGNLQGLVGSSLKSISALSDGEDNEFDFNNPAPRAITGKPANPLDDDIPF